MTALDLITRAMRLVGVLADSESPTASEGQDALSALNDMVDAWGTEELAIYAYARNLYTLVANQQGYTIGSGGDFSQVRPIFLQNVGILPAGQAIALELPIQLLTRDQWARTPTKTVTATFPTQVWYNYGHTAVLGKLWFWPIPTTAPQVAIYTPTPVTQFAALATDYSFPPGYARALRYNLALELATEFGRQTPPAVAATAVASKADIKRANIQLYDMSVDAGLLSRGSLWNYYTGEPM